ncbi:hypothetical protein CEV32_3700 [Brucella rhizosphaerae]|uniref:Uncharacterized protein n=1 Tax=Brucella rhizosphaerae TaxID=571254 RepID=A0A256FT46_9HYPH|nr:hypothetical protein CEV32_3700 [Brucella rhizosphaerae]
MVQCSRKQAQAQFNYAFMWWHTIIGANCILSSFDPYKGNSILLLRLQEAK